MKMDYKFIVLLLAVVLAGVAGGYTSRVSAVQPHPYGLFDGNGTYLGDIIGTQYFAHYGSGIPNSSYYTTYLPSIDGILQFRYNSVGEVVIDSVPEEVRYQFPDCAGRLYITSQGVTPFTSPWIVKVLNQTYRVSAVATGANTESLNNGDGTFCQNVSTSVSSYELTPVTLPFNQNTVVPPFKIK
jgi:hypothetical protein